MSHLRTFVNNFSRAYPPSNGTSLFSSASLRPPCFSYLSTHLSLFFNPSLSLLEHTGASLQLPNNDEYIPSDVARWTVTLSHRNQIELWEIWQLTFKIFKRSNPFSLHYFFFFFLTAGRSNTGRGGAASDKLPSKVSKFITHLTRCVSQVTVS